MTIKNNNYSNSINNTIISVIIINTANIIISSTKAAIIKWRRKSSPAWSFSVIFAICKL